jgi:hypothetical protein
MICECGYIPAKLRCIKTNCSFGQKRGSIYKNGNGLAKGQEFVYKTE